MNIRMRSSRGVGMIEVLVALVIIAVGLLGLAGVQVQAQKAELESYQRAQALILMQDMASRIRANHSAARCYETAGYIGQKDGADDISADPQSCSGWGTTDTRALADRDLADWDALLEGSAELLDGESVGSMTSARGCIVYDPPEDEYTVSVAWQGEVVTAAVGNSCAADTDYGGAGLRRVVSTVVAIPDLD